MHNDGAFAAVGQGADQDAAAAFDAALAQVDATLDGPPDLAVAFVGSAHAGEIGALAERLARLARVSLGVTAQGVIAGGVELERADAVSVWAARLPGATLTPLRYPPPADDPAAAPPRWPELPDAAGVIVLCDAFTFPADAFLAWVAQATPGLPVSGGLASGATRPGDARLVLDGEVYRDGAVAVALGGAVRLRHLVSQGCRPVGPAYVVTASDHNLVGELAGRPPRERIAELFAAAPPRDQQLLRTGLHLGIVLDEYAEDPQTGDFLVRGVLGSHPATGALAVGDVVSVGQTVRFHVRDADSADAELCAMLAEVTADQAVGGLLFTCNGRGRRLFERADHDAELVAAALDAAPVGGFFAAGEIGPLGGRSWLHGYTASLLVIEPASGNGTETRP